jgi:hypothetical protein
MHYNSGVCSHCFPFISQWHLCIGLSRESVLLSASQEGGCTPWSFSTWPIKFQHHSFQAFAVLQIWYIIFWVFPRRLNIISLHFGTLCRFHLHRWWRWNRQRVPKRRLIIFRRWGNTQKIIYQNFNNFLL